jgi:hypothetical protein
VDHSRKTRVLRGYLVTGPGQYITLTGKDKHGWLDHFKAGTLNTTISVTGAGNVKVGVDKTGAHYVAPDSGMITVDGRRQGGVTPIRDGSSIQLGTTTLRYRTSLSGPTGGTTRTGATVGASASRSSW